MMPLSPEARAEMVGIVARHFGLDFPQSRWPDLDRAVERTLPGWAPDIAAARLGLAQPGSPELIELIRWLTVGETSFFRDAASFAALEREVLPSLIEQRRAQNQRS